MWLLHSAKRPREGSQVTKQHNQLLTQIQKGKRDGASLFMDLMRHGGSDHKGIFIAPCLLANVTEDMRACQLDAFIRITFVPLQTRSEILRCWP